MQRVDIYYYSIKNHGLPDQTNRYLSVLDENEKKRFERFLRLEPKLNFGLSRYFLKSMLATILERPTQEIRFEYTDNGKPFLVDTPELHFNLSHCKSAIVFAIGSLPLGIDIEAHNRRGDSWRQAGEFINPAVGALVEAENNDNEKARSFSLYWTSMEAYTKFKAGKMFEEKEGFCGEGETLLSGQMNQYQECNIFSYASENKEQISLAFPLSEHVDIQKHVLDPLSSS